jgi:Tfp pilus assembly protein PilO
MKAYRRRRQQYLLATLLAVLGVINLLFFVIMYRPVRSEYFTLQDSIQKARTDIRTRQYNIDRLEKLNAQLETSSQDRERLYTMHFIPKATGWSRILPELDAMIQMAGVKNTRKEYGLEEKPEHGLYSVKIRLPVSGSYPNVVNLIKDIESAETFFIINSVDVRPNAPGSAEVSMNLNLETFFYQ